MASIFSKIVSGEIPSYKVGETETCCAFLDIFPLVKGHTLIIPKKEVDYLFDLPDELYSELHRFSKVVAIALAKAVACRRVGVAVLGMEVPHAHIHLIPLQRENDMNFSNPKLKLTVAEMEEIAGKIRGAMNQ